MILGMQLASLINFRGPLIRDLKAAGHEVVVVCADIDPMWLPKFQEFGVRLIEAPLKRTSMNPLRDLYFFFWLIGCLRREKPDCFFAFQVKAVGYGLPAAWLARIPRRAAMIEGLGMSFGKGDKMLLRLIARTVLTTLYACGLRRAGVLFFLNKRDRDFFSRPLYVTKRTKVVLLDGIGLDLSHFTPVPMPGGPLKVLTIARAQIDKGLRVFAEGARILKQEFPEIRFIRLGGAETGPARVPADEMQKWVDGGYFENLGETTDIRPYINESHIVVLLSLFGEGLPRALMEAMATGRAIMATDVPGNRETIVDGQNGFLLQPNDVNGFVAAVRHAVGHRDALEKMGAAGRQLAVERFDVGAINRKIIAELEQL